MAKTILLCGATGFIGRNLLERFAADPAYRVRAVWHKKKPLPRRGVEWVKADLCRQDDVRRVMKDVYAVIQAAATTSGSKDIVERPYTHVTDNAVMNSLLMRAAFEENVERFVFFSCTVMYAVQQRPVREEDFAHAITDRYYGVGWTKVYVEKMCEFYSRLGRTKFTAIRHSNIYGPHDKYDLERSHVFGATVAKVMTSKDGRVVVWGKGTEKRDLLYVDDLVDFTAAALKKQKTPFELVNVGSGRAVSVAELVKLIIKRSGRKLTIAYDRSKPSIPFRLAVDSRKARARFGWRPKVSLEKGVDRSLAWYKKHVA